MAIDVGGVYVATPSAMVDRQQRSVRFTQYGALVVSLEGSAGPTATAPAGTAADPQYTQSAPLPAGTDRSGSATTASTQTIAANTARRGLNIQNIGANNIGVNEFGGTAAIGTAGTYTLAPGSTMNVRTNRAISMIAATAATPFTATEF